ncbi:hypothetical protein [Chryseobacterium luteum]|uniref:Transporter n=1 Tax=Chryseobacterium luteum TaxID=421531 RepID=A0A085ZVX7_9FLAO|nr:hypothetical protein [Chryseobacterium luteum]KFF08591.1 hypothetical protein IX38_03830 [Chryseobacterium luteum]
MKTFKFLLGTAILLLLQSNYIFAQGCSDAGFCTVNSFQPNSNDSIKSYHNQIKTGIFFGKADNSISVFGNYVEYNRQLGDKLGIDAKLTTLAQNGNDISSFGLSDLFLNANYKAGNSLKFTLGAKIPLSDAGNSNNNLPLPMDYQSSLGTFDLILGVGYEFKKIQLVAALQQPLTQNDNQFLVSQYPASSELRGFLSTNKFQRSGDVLLRVSYPLMINSKIRLTPSILPIYHLKNDRFTNQNNVEQEIKNSEGLTLNGNVYLDYEINQRNGIQLNMGVPFLVRKSRPDGLTRSFIANVEYRIKF